MTEWTKTAPEADGFYWVRRADEAPEVYWYEGFWYAPADEAGMEGAAMAGYGYEFWPERIEPPNANKEAMTAKIETLLRQVADHAASQHPVDVLKETVEKLFPGRELDHGVFASWRAYMDAPAESGRDIATETASACACLVCHHCSAGDELIEPTDADQDYAHRIRGSVSGAPCKASAIHRLVRSRETKA